MRFCTHFIFFLLVTLLNYPLSASEALKPLSTAGELVVKKQHFPDLDLVYLELKNGMKVYIKRTKDTEGVDARLTALGGYAELPEKERASGFLAAKAILQSGLGSYTQEKLFALFYENSMDLNVEILPHGRYLGGSAPVANTETLLRFIQLFFNESRIEKESFEKVKSYTIQKSLNRKQEAEESFDEAYLAFNAPELKLPGKFSLDDLKGARQEIAQIFVSRAFKNPADFSAVISGPFQLQTMTALVENYLGTIPRAETGLSNTQYPHFSISETGVKTKAQKNSSKNDEYLTAITFPVKVPLDPANFAALEDVATLLRKRLKKQIRSLYGMDSVLYVSIEHPLYPQMSSAWIKILYMSSAKQISPMGQTILIELKKMQEGLASDNEINKMYRKRRKRLRQREKDNYHWLFLLSNYGTLNWSSDVLSQNIRQPREHKKVDEVLKVVISLDNYTVFTQ